MTRREWKQAWTRTLAESDRAKEKMSSIKSRFEQLDLRSFRLQLLLSALKQKQAAKLTLKKESAENNDAIYGQVKKQKLYRILRHDHFHANQKCRRQDVVGLTYMQLKRTILLESLIAAINQDPNN